MKKRITKGFTLVEIMIVVAIIGLLIAIALPNFIKARKKSVFRTAQASIRQVEGAVEQAKLDGAWTNLTWNIANIKLVVAPNYVKVWPTCPGGGSWDVVVDSGNSLDWLVAKIGTATIYTTNEFSQVEADL